MQRFGGDETLNHPDLGLVDVRKLLLAASPATALAAPHTGSPIANMVLDGWELLPRLLPADAYNLLCDLLSDPQPLLNALARLPRTLLHGDYRRGNLGLRRTPQPRVIVFDWSSAAYAAPAIDLSWLMYLPSHPALPLEKAAARYRQKLEQRLKTTFEDRAWEKQMALGLLVNAARTAVFKAFVSALDGNSFAQQDTADLQVYAEQIQQGVRWLLSAAKVAGRVKRGIAMLEHTAAVTTAGALPEESVQAFAAGLRGELLRPGDEGYERSRQVWNGLIDRHPALIARCQGVADVMAAVNFGRTHNLLISMRGGGHNVAGTAVCESLSTL